METGRIAGMSVGTLLVAAVGPNGAIAVDAAAFAAAGVCFAFLRNLAAPPRADGGKGPLRDLLDGWSEFGAHRWVWVVVAQFTVVNAVWSGTVTVLGPAVADETFGRGAWGLLLTVNSLGMLLGGVPAARRQPRRAGCPCPSLPSPAS